MSTVGWVLVGLLGTATATLAGAAFLVVIGWPQKATRTAWRAGYERGWREHRALAVGKTPVADSLEIPKPDDGVYIREAFDRWHRREHDDVVLIEQEIMASRVKVDPMRVEVGDD